MKQKANLEKKVSIIIDDEGNSDTYIKDMSLTNSVSSDKNGSDKGATTQMVMPDGPEASVSSKGGGKVVAVSQKDIDGEQSGQGNSRLMLVMVFVLAGVLGLIIFRSMGISFSGGQTQKPNEPVSEKIQENTSDVEIDWETPESTSKDLVLFGHQGSQPVRQTQPTLPKQPRRSSSIVVQGIIYSNDHKSAIIGKKIVSIGEKVMGADIVNITRRSVEFRKDGVSWTQNVGKKGRE